MYTYTYIVYIDICIYVYVYTCINIYIYTYIYIYIGISRVDMNEEVWQLYHSIVVEDVEVSYYIVDLNEEVGTV